MACCDSDSDQEYPRRWMDRHNYSDIGEILIIFSDIFILIM